MRTDSQAYSEYLQAKYFPGRRLYLSWIFYPRILRCFATDGTIIDLGCGTGEFLRYCRSKDRKVLGVDSNEVLANRCRQEGFEVLLDNICELTSLPHRFQYAICDNVLEHLDQMELAEFFARLETLLLPGGVFVCIVPGVRGYKCDPTHKTYVCHEVLTNLLEGRSLQISREFLHPMNFPYVDRFCYLNMQVFEIHKSR